MSKVAVVGGGVIGSAAAVWLADEGFDVTVFEGDPEGRPASSGNAGILSLPSVLPFARPSMIKSAPFWLTDPLGPLACSIRDLPAMAPWLMRFALAARPRQVRRGSEALKFLMSTAIADHQELARRAGVPFQGRHTGALYIYDTEASFRSSLSEWRARADQGVAYEELSPDQVREENPALERGFARAVLAPSSWMAASPLANLAALRAAVARQGRQVNERVVKVSRGRDQIIVSTDVGRSFEFDRVVVAAGVWSRDLVRSLGLRITLEAERGYTTTYPDPGFELSLPVFFADHGFVGVSLREGLRVGGAVELAAPEKPPNFARAAAMRTKIRRYVPGLPENGGEEWMGCRPSTPDSLPVIGPHPRDRRIVFAFGHGHVGLTLSATTARHVAGLVAGRTPDGQLQVLGIERFQ